MHKGDHSAKVKKSSESLDSSQRFPSGPSSGTKFSVAMVADCLFEIGVADICKSIFTFSFSPYAFADDLDCTTRILVVNGVSVFARVPSLKPMPAGRANWKHCASKSGEGLFEQNAITALLTPGGECKQLQVSHTWDTSAGRRRILWEKACWQSGKPAKQWKM